MTRTSKLIIGGCLTFIILGILWTGYNIHRSVAEIDYLGEDLCG